jgi:hypothetical protein
MLDMEGKRDKSRRGPISSRKEKIMVQATTRDELFREGKLNQFGPVK